MTRRTLRHLVAIALTALLPALSGMGEAAAAPLKTLGFDDMSCRAWSQSRDDAERRAVYVAWIRGLLTGHNYARPAQQVSTISSGTIENYVDRYCKDHPQGGFDEAALRLSDQFSGRNAPITK